MRALGAYPPLGDAQLSLLLFVAKSPPRRARLKVNPLGSVPRFPLRYLAKNRNARPFSVLPSWSVPKFYVPARGVASPRTEVSTSPNGGFDFPQRRFSLPPTGVLESPNGGFHFPAWTISHPCMIGDERGVMSDERRGTRMKKNVNGRSLHGAKEPIKLRKRGRGLRVERSDTARRGSAIGRRGTAQDEEAVSGRRSIAPRSAVQAPGAPRRGTG